MAGPGIHRPGVSEGARTVGRAEADGWARAGIWAQGGASDHVRTALCAHGLNRWVRPINVPISVVHLLRAQRVGARCVQRPRFFVCDRFSRARLRQRKYLQQRGACCCGTLRCQQRKGTKATASPAVGLCEHITPRQRHATAVTDARRTSRNMNGLGDKVCWPSAGKGSDKQAGFNLCQPGI